MGRIVTGAKNPVVLYVSGGNTQSSDRARLKENCQITGKSNRVFTEKIPNIWTVLRHAFGRFHSHKADVPKEFLESRKILQDVAKTSIYDLLFSIIY